MSQRSKNRHLASRGLPVPDDGHGCESADDVQPEPLIQEPNDVGPEIDIDASVDDDSSADAMQNGDAARLMLRLREVLGLLNGGTLINCLSGGWIVELGGAHPACHGRAAALAPDRNRHSNLDGSYDLRDTCSRATEVYSKAVRQAVPPIRNKGAVLPS